MRRGACLAAAVISTAGSGLAPGAQALVFRVPTPARTGGRCQNQRGSFCNSRINTPAVSNAPLGAAGSAWGWARRAESQVQQRRGLSMSATATEAKVESLDGSTPEKLPDEISADHPLRVVIAGGGVGGLLSAKYLKMQGYDVSLSLVRCDTYMMILLRTRYTAQLLYCCTSTGCGCRALLL